MTDKDVKIQVYDDVWDALEDDPVKRENLKLMSELRMARELLIAVDSDD